MFGRPARGKVHIPGYYVIEEVGPKAMPETAAEPEPEPEPDPAPEPELALESEPALAPAPTVPTDDEFAEMVEAALATVPARFLDAMENVQVVVQEEPDPWQLAFAQSGTSQGVELLGLYSGVALTRRGNEYGASMVAPDTISIFKAPHVRCFFARGDMQEQVRRTVVHEIGHYFGMNEAEVRAMGY